MTNDETRFHALKFALQHNAAEGGGCYDVIEAAQAFLAFLENEEVVNPHVQADVADPELADMTASYPLNDWVSEQLADPDEPVAQADSPQTESPRPWIDESFEAAPEFAALPGEEKEAILDMLAPSETPFTVNIGETRSSNTLHEWQTNSLTPTVEQDPASITELDEMEGTPEDFQVILPAPTEAEITEAVEAIASSPPPAPDASDEDEMTDEQVERAEDRLRDPVANSQTQLLSAGQALSKGSVLADAGNVETPYVNTFTRTKWPWMP